MLRSFLQTSASILSVTRNVLSSNLRNPAFRRFLSQEARAKIQAAVQQSPVVLFMKGNPQMPQCGFSRAAVQVLDIQGVPPEKLKTYDVLEDPELRSGIKEFSDWPTVPQIYVNGEFVGGCDILLGMHQSGELESLLEKHDIIPKISTESSSERSS
ncbi:glutaredoxin-like protein [Boletus edulis BED1]|uniref:Monothiol glutaredoxin-5, mitochondrial n=1 Tax=Boletus edulis BED1 TaxID=1328754 RepID=A0AAD4GEX0_BOLED|nr:glutaredoxin-like protein [Boletus edulis BED1]